MIPWEAWIVSPSFTSILRKDSVLAQPHDLLIPLTFRPLWTFVKSILNNSYNNNFDAEQEQSAGSSFLKIEVILSNTPASEINGCVNISFKKWSKVSYVRLSTRGQTTAVCYSELNDTKILVPYILMIKTSFIQSIPNIDKYIS